MLKQLLAFQEMSIQMWTSLSARSSTTKARYSLCFSHSISHQSTKSTRRTISLSETLNHNRLEIPQRWCTSPSSRIPNCGLLTRQDYALVLMTCSRSPRRIGVYSTHSALSSNCRRVFLSISSQKSQRTQICSSRTAGKQLHATTKTYPLSSSWLEAIGSKLARSTMRLTFPPRKIDQSAVWRSGLTLLMRLYLVFHCSGVITTSSMCRTTD